MPGRGVHGDAAPGGCAPTETQPRIRCPQGWQDGQRLKQAVLEANRSSSLEGFVINNTAVAISLELVLAIISQCLSLVWLDVKNSQVHFIVPPVLFAFHVQALKPQKWLLNCKLHTENTPPGYQKGPTAGLWDCS
ncbi:hypothetical protein AAES_162727 [Amazona aestiva]|uniref:Uncharacterized protein n=1 Tax=Amazona aestiva TaxID=12930 RepID=A0A0Q3T0L7_AMAAE|nr:hypothetical protein AAES_162727 [Amazona aestiva]